MTEEVKAEIPEEVKTEPTLYDKVRTEREALEKVRDEAKVIVDKLERLRADEILSGKTEAGQPQEEKPKEETPKEYADRILKGDFEEHAV